MPITIDDVRRQLYAPAPVEEADTPLLKEMGTGFKRGLFVAAPALAGGALKAFAPVDSSYYKSGQELQDASTAIAGLPEMQKSGTKRGFVGETLVAGAEGVGQMAPVIGVGAVSPLAAGILAAGLYGGSTYQDTKERMLKQEGIDDTFAAANPTDPRVQQAKKTALQTGLVQGAGEAAMSYLGGRFLKGAFPKFGTQTAEGIVAGVAKPGATTLKNFGKAWGAEIVGEGVTEPLQDEGQAAIERAAGLKDAPAFMAQAADSAKGGVGTALLLGPLAGGGHYKAFRNAAEVQQALVDPSVDPAIRVKAATVMGSEIAKVDQAAAANFLTHAADAIGDKAQTGSDPYGLDLESESVLQPYVAPAAAVAATPIVAAPPSGTLGKALAAGGVSTQPLAGPELFTAEPVAAAPVPALSVTRPPLAGPVPSQPIATTNELVFDEARAWAVERIAKGNGALMQQMGEKPAEYKSRLVDTYQKLKDVPMTTNGGQIKLPAMVASDTASKVIAPSKAPHNVVKPESDHLITAIVKNGGLDLTEARREMGTSFVKDNNLLLNKQALSQRNKFGHVFKTGGLALDKMRESLVADGYLAPESTVNDLAQAIDKATRGQHTYTQQYVPNEKELSDAEVKHLKELYGDQAGEFTVPDEAAPVGESLRDKAKRYAANSWDSVTAEDLDQASDVELAGFIADHERIVKQRSRGVAGVQSIGSLIAERRGMTPQKKETSNDLPQVRQEAVKPEEVSSVRGEAVGAVKPIAEQRTDAGPHIGGYVRAVQDHLRDKGIEAKIGIQGNNVQIDMSRAGVYLGTAHRTLTANGITLDQIDSTNVDDKQTPTGILRPLYESESAFIKKHGIDVHSDLLHDKTLNKYSEFYNRKADTKGKHSTYFEPTNVGYSAAETFANDQARKTAEKQGGLKTHAIIYGNQSAESVAEQLTALGVDYLSGSESQSTNESEAVSSDQKRSAGVGKSSARPETASLANNQEVRPAGEVTTQEVTAASPLIDQEIASMSLDDMASLFDDVAGNTGAPRQERDRLKLRETQRKHITRKILQTKDAKEVKRLQVRLAELQAAAKAEQEPAPIISGTFIAGLQVTFNKEKSGIELRFDGRPDEAVLTKIKSMGFRWSRGQRVWYAKDSPLRRSFAEGLQGKVETPTLSNNQQWTIRDLGPVGSKVTFNQGFNNRTFTITDIDVNGKVAVDKEKIYRFASDFKRVDEISAAQTSAPKVEKSAAAIIKAAAKSGVKGAGEALQGLHDLFGGSRIKSFPVGLDEETYAKAKPHFQAALQNFREAGKSLREFFTFLVDQFGAAIKPYAMRYMTDLQQENGTITVAPSADSSIMVNDSDVTTEKGDSNHVTTTDGRGPRVRQTDTATGKTGSSDPTAGINSAAPAPVVLEAGMPDDVGTVEPDGNSGTIRTGTGVSLRPGGTEVSASGNVPNGRQGTGRAGNTDSGSGGRSGGSGRGITTSNSVTTPLANYHITDPEALIGGTPKVRFAHNRAAIETYLAVIADSRNATEAERDAIAGYIGWGSFGQELFNGTWTRPQPKSGWEKEDAWLREHLSKEQWESAQRSIINAHYTDPITVTTLYALAQRLGFKQGRILEPSLGIGNLFGLMPRDMMVQSQLTGIELDEMTGGMAKLLYPQANIQIKGYEDSKTADNFYDLVIGNWPFAKDGPVDRRYLHLSPSLHDYFFLKALDQVRVGGLVIGITSSGSMDKQGRNSRLEMAKKADLVAAFRLPSGAFEKYAGTSVVTDILIFKKRDEPNKQPGTAGWIDTVEMKFPAGKINVNEYYQKNPEHVLGTLAFGQAMGRLGMIVQRPDDLEQLLKELPTSLPQNVFNPRAQNKQIISYITNNTKDRQQSIVVDESGKLMVVQGEYLAPLEEVEKIAVASAKDTAARLDQIKRLAGIRKLYGTLLEAERSATDPESARKALNSEYRTFVKLYGTINQSYGLGMFKKIGDPFHAAIAALEISHGEKGKQTYTPAKILTESTMRKKSATGQMTIKDAFVIARNEAVDVDIERIAELAKQPVDKVLSELVSAGAIYHTPAGTYEVSDQYLSGNVRRKLREAEEAQTAGMDMTRNIAELTKLIPPTKPYYKIEAKAGAPWVPTAVYSRFIADLLAEESTNGIEFVNRLGSWRVTIPDGIIRKPEATTIWGHATTRFTKIVRAALNNTSITVKVRDSEGNLVVDDQSTKEVNEKVALLREEFSSWIWKDVSRRIEMETTYNEIMNSTADARFDGSFMTFEGMALHRGNSAFGLRKHQVDAIWRGVVNRGGLYAHEVGTGKTYTMGGVAVESRRYGIARKPLIFAHNANSSTVAREIQEMYPAAKVLYVDNLTPDTIDITLRQIANDDWDAVVVPHSLIKRFSLTRETLSEIAAEEIAQMEEEAIEAAQEDNIELTVAMMDDEEAMKRVRSATAKELVRSRNAIIRRINEMAAKASREGAVTFEELGVDMIIIDEAHIFKKPPLITKMKLKGLNTATSGQSLALHLLAGYVKKMNNGKGIHAFTGTPITNTLNEVYNMMRYFMDSEMERDGVKGWDSWFNTFADAVSDVELTAAGEFEAVTRLSQFVNAKELRRMMGQYTDVVFADDMPEFTPRTTTSGKTMQDNDLTVAEKEWLTNGRTENPQGRPYKKVVTEVCAMGAQQQAKLQELVELARLFRAASKKDRRDMMLSGHPASPVLVETAAANAGLDIRLIDLEAEDNPESKVNKAVRRVIEYYKADKHSAQVIFMDRGFSDKSTSTRTMRDGSKIKSTKSRLNLAKDIVDKLVAGGLNRSQIAIVDGSMSKEKRKETADGMNSGKIRVVIGSTQTLGTGVNMQDNLRAMHHLDAPWMPGELEQRNGRGWRQGNRYNTVMEHRYLTEKLDGRRWQVLVVKDRIIKAFLAGDADVIDGDAVGLEEGENAADLAATLSEAAGDPRLLLREKYRKQVDKLQSRERMHSYGAEDAALEAVRQDAKFNDWQKDEKLWLADIATYEKSKESAFAMVVDGKTYTDRNEALEAMTEKLATLTSPKDKPLRIAEYRGFTVYGNVNWVNPGEYNITLQGAHTYTAKPSLLSIDSTLRHIPNSYETMKKRFGTLNESADRLREAAREPFPREKELKQKSQLLHDLIQDLHNNPVPPPSWLRHGAQVGGQIYIDGTPHIVDGHRWTESGYYVTIDKDGKSTDVSYDTVQDESGFKIYEPHPFVAPVVHVQGQSGTQAATTDEPTSFMRQPIAKGAPVPRELVDSIITRVTVGWTDADRQAVILLDRFDQLPAQVLAQAKKTGYDNNSPKERIYGVMHKGLIYLVHENLSSPLQVEEVLLHERLHRILYGQGDAKLIAMMNSLLIKMGGSKGLVDLADRAGFDFAPYRKQGANLPLAKRSAFYVEEFLTNIEGLRAYEKLPAKALRVVREFWGKFRDWLKANGFDLFAEFVGMKMDTFTQADLAFTLRGLRGLTATRENDTALFSGNDLMSRLAANGITAEKLEQLFARVGITESAKFAAAWHGSPHDFDKFSTEYIGIGEGNQAYGYGLYFAGSKDVAEYYREVLSRGNALSMEELTNYFTPGQIIPSYGGQDRVVSFNKGDNNHGWTVTVQHVDAQGEQIKGPEGRSRTHYTMPSAKDYEKVTGEKPKRGSLYQVELAPNEDEYLLWDKKLSEQSEQVRSALRNWAEESRAESIANMESRIQHGFQGVRPGELERIKAMSADEYLADLSEEGNFTGEDLYRDIRETNDGDAQTASEYLHSLGIRGIKYLDGTSRSQGEGNYNYVIFNEDDVDVVAKFLIGGIETFKPDVTIDKVKDFLNPLDYSRFRQFTESNLTEKVKDAIGFVAQTPYWKQEQDEAAKPFYTLGRIREENRLENNVRMLGGIADKSGAPVKGMQKLKDFFAWSEERTKWEDLKRQQYNVLTDAERTQYDIIRAEGDAHGSEYKSLLTANQNPRIKAAKVTPRVFAFYRQALAAEDLAFEQNVAIAKENMIEAGMNPEEIAGMIAEFRNKHSEIKGWVHRDHGEGEHVTTVHHVIDRLDFQTDEVKRKEDGSDAFRVRLGYYPGVQLATKMQAIVKQADGDWIQTKDGTIIMLFKPAAGEQALNRLNEIELKREGGGYHKVMVYNHFNPTIAAAKKLQGVVEKDLKAAMPVNYREGHAYEVGTSRSSSLQESDYGDLKKGDMAMERFMSEALKRAANRGELTREDAAEMRQAMVQNIAETLLGRGAGLYQIRRAEYLIEGYDRTNAVAKFESYVSGTAGMLSKAMYALRQFKALEKSPIEIRRWAAEYIANTLRNMGRADRISGDVRAFASLWYLGGNLTWMLINHTQPYVFGQAELSRYTKGAMQRIVKAEKDILTKKLTAAEKALWDDPRVRVQIEETVMAEMAGSDAGVGGKVSQALHKATRFSMAHGHKVEVLNRKMMILAGYRAMIEQGKSPQEALATALDINSAVNIDMGRYNLPGFAAKWAAGRTVYALQSFIQHALQYLYYRGTSGEWKDQKAILRLLFVMGLIGGLPAALPGSDELDKIMRRIFGYSPKLALKGWSRRTAKEYGTVGEMLDGFVWRGIPGAAAPTGVAFSLTNNVQFRLPIISNLLAGDDMAKSMTGAVGGLVQKFTMATRQALKGDLVRAAEYAAPTVIGNVMSGARQMGGVTTTHGKPVEFQGKQLKMSATEGAMRSIGLQPARTADIQEVRQTERQLQADWNEKRQDAMDRFRIEKKLKYVQEFNQSLKKSQAMGLVNLITAESLQRALKPKTDKKKAVWERQALTR